MHKVLRDSTPSHIPLPFRTQARRALAWQVPPRRFFAYWCEGLSAGEALGVLLWFGLNAWWLGQLCSRSFANATSATKRLEK